MTQNLNEHDTDDSKPPNDIPTVHMNSNFEWEYDPSINPSTIFAKVKIIGQGSFGTVAEILHSPSMTILAGKLINQNFVENDQSKTELSNEIDILRQINSPYTIKYFGSVPLEGSLMILMEYCDRCSLRNILDARQQVLSEDQISFVMHDLLKGIEFIHNNYQMVHRDIKCSNILLNSNGDIKISDFDISKIFASQSFQNMTIIGAPYWMAPEVISGISYSYEADIWSIGITAVELCEGAPPFAELDPTKAMIEIAIKGFPGYRFPSMHSPELCDFISHCIETDPSKRWKIEQLLEHPFVKRSENLDRMETLQNILIEKEQINTNSTNINNSNSIYNSRNYNDTNSKINPENYGTFMAFDESDLNPELQAQIQAGKHDLPNGHSFVKHHIDGNSFEGMAMIMSQKFDNGNFDSFNSGSFNASMSDFGNFSDDDPFKPDNNVIHQINSNDASGKNFTNQGVRNYDSMSDFNIPFGQSTGTDSLNFGTFQQQQNSQISNSGCLIINQQNDISHSEPTFISNHPSNSNTIGVSPQPSGSPFGFVSNNNMTLNQVKKKNEFEYFNPSFKQRSNNMKNVPDKLFVEVSRALSTKIPFVPFSSSPQLLEKPSSKDKKKIKNKKKNEDEDSIDNKINKIRLKLTRSPPLIALTILLIFFFIFGIEAVLPLLGLLIIVSLIYKHYKTLKKMKKEENKDEKKVTNDETTK